MVIGMEEQKGSSSPSEEVVPMVLLRVLLVEPDDSTRHIIAALLRKCGYRVAAVSDGLKAWETIKRRPNNIDLILTEVDLPSISGYALLTLVMEHEVCKSIPVIMMSSHDSISIVLKCMFKGAADFLIKPVRKNELRNLWQHVWRRQSKNAALVPNEQTSVRDKIEATSESNKACNHSSEKDKEYSEKGSEAHSTCTMPYLEAESAYRQKMQGLPQINCESAFSLSNIYKQEECGKLIEKSVEPKCETGGKSISSGPEEVTCNETFNSNAYRLQEEAVCSKTNTMDVDGWPQSHREQENIINEIHCDPDDLLEPSAAIDLIGKFRNEDSEKHFSANLAMDSFSGAPYLELSLRGSYPSYSKDEGLDEQKTPLNHFNASPFSRYESMRTSQLLFQTMDTSCAKLEEGASPMHYQLTNQQPENSFCTSPWHGPHGAILGKSQESKKTMVVGHSGEAAAALRGSQFGFIHLGGVDNDTSCPDHIFPHMSCKQSDFTQVRSSMSAGYREQTPFPLSPSLNSTSEVYNTEQDYHPVDGTTNHSSGVTVHEEDNNVNSGEGLRHPPVPGGNETSTLSNSITSKLNSSSCGSICTTVDGNDNSAAPVAKASVSESVNDSNLLVHNGLIGMDPHPTQREAALLKFRLKRKDRCFDKKVRYQSRKRLAEQRPRVRGQFVRQVQAQHTAAAVDIS
ncbi:hypothetical protein RJ640_006803 [Escallonia rubra]|uniref:Uncharacterized protein n=1 Tax=Escallonia rubra TaxID=112253 RepID=A0AA88UPL0_9ASTE|nr:hypothetical protein RJ640_006803 [Escallonia rubra]